MYGHAYEGPAGAAGECRAQRRRAGQGCTGLGCAARSQQRRRRHPDLPALPHPPRPVPAQTSLERGVVPTPGACPKRCAGTCERCMHPRCAAPPPRRPCWRCLRGCCCSAAPRCRGWRGGVAGWRGGGGGEGRGGRGAHLRACACWRRPSLRTCTGYPTRLPRASQGPGPERRAAWRLVPAAVLCGRAERAARGAASDAGGARPQRLGCARASHSGGVQGRGVP